MVFKSMLVHDKTTLKHPDFVFSSQTCKYCHKKHIIDRNCIFPANGTPYMLIHTNIFIVLIVIGIIQ